MAHLFAQLSIRSKIIAGFAAVLICTIGLGLFSTQRLDAVNGNAQVIRDNYLPGTRHPQASGADQRTGAIEPWVMLLATTDASAAVWSDHQGAGCDLRADAGRLSAAVSPVKNNA